MDGLMCLGAEVLPFITTNPDTGEMDHVFLSAVGVETIPTAGANYTDAKTVAAVQSALVAKGYDLGTSGPNGDGVDGMFGSKTKAAIKKMQADINLVPTGIIDEGVIATLKVTPGVLPPGVTIQGRAALQAQVALDAATAAEHASTPGEVSSAADAISQAAAAAEPPLPPEVEAKAMAAVQKAKSAKTSAEVKAAAQEVKAAAKEVHASVKPSWWKEPTWTGGPERWRVVVAGGATVALGTAFAMLLRMKGKLG